MSKLKTLFFYLFILLLVLLLARNLIVRVVAEGITKAAMGLTLSTHSINISLIKSAIDITELKLSNPEGFPEPTMLDMPVIYVDYDIGDLLKGKVHIQHLKVYLSEFFVVKDKEGALNLNSLKLVKGEKEKATVKKKEGKKLPLKIDILDLKIGKVLYKDYSKSAQPKVREFNVDINERYENITDINSFGALLVVRALANTTIAQLAGFDIGPLKDEVSGVLKSVSKLTTGVATGAIKVGKDTGTKAVDTVGAEAKKIIEEIEQILPFSSKKTEK